MLLTSVEQQQQGEGEIGTFRVIVEHLYHTKDGQTDGREEIDQGHAQKQPFSREQAGKRFCLGENHRVQEFLKKNQ